MTHEEAMQDDFQVPNNVKLDSSHPEQGEQRDALTLAIKFHNILSWRIAFRHDPYRAQTHFLWINAPDKTTQQEIKRAAYDYKGGLSVDVIDEVIKWHHYVDKPTFTMENNLPSVEGILKDAQNPIPRQMTKKKFITYCCIITALAIANIILWSIFISRL